MAFSTINSKQENTSGITDEFPYSCTVSNFSKFISHSITWHVHEELELNYVKQGSIKIYTNTSSYIIEEGEAYLINTNVLNIKTSINPERPAVEINYHFHPVLLAGHFHSVYEKKYMNPVLQNHYLEIARFTSQSENGNKIIKMLKQLASVKSTAEGYEFKIRNILSDAWILMLKEIHEYEAGMPKNYAVNQNRLQYMIAFIHRHYSEKISVEDIAASANISTREATRCFKKVRGKSPVDYLIEYRLTNARNLLTLTDDPITEIALKTGFNDSAYFGKTFKKYFGMTPVDYRKANSSHQNETAFDLSMDFSDEL